MSKSDNLFDQARQRITDPKAVPVKDRVRQCGRCGYDGPEAAMHQTNGMWFHNKNCLRVS